MSNSADFIAYLTSLQKAGHVRAYVDIAWALSAIGATAAGSNTAPIIPANTDIDGGGFEVLHK